ncbi:SDR family oxidoreductase [Rubricoccus marinus]|uniref:NAD(P)-dependent oxidoreductase n=1 Tax=Rubricoccus marinus TaxID=716817 RepID=A0A259TUB3_9BACT|nr:SDR family oxidoreductase [Rubricoccus marinus]OZC01207.1 NAD(P)-dependent oxidoreductase [Rubricoccus marinus]
MIAITGSTGHLGRLVIAKLIDRGVPAADIVALARDTDKASDLADQGVVVREGNYDKPETLGPALDGVDTLLLISSSEVGQRARQHRAVIGAAKAAGVGLIAYTSVLHADTSELGLAEEHRQTEAALAESGVPTVLLRNGWYTENYTGSIAPALEHGVVLGSAGDAQIAAATREDFAEAAAAVLTSDEDQTGQTYELAGEPFTMSEYAAELSRQSGTSVTYQNLPEDDYQNALVGAGLPEPVAAMLAQSDVAARGGALDDDSGDLERLLGRPPTPLADAIRNALS